MNSLVATGTDLEKINDVLVFYGCFESIPICHSSSVNYLLEQNYREIH